MTSTRDRNRERKRLQRERQRPVDAIVYETEDWQLFLSEDTLPQKAGCYPEQLAGLVLRELVDNALDEDAGATIRYEAGWWIVSDDGPGVDPDRVADLFAVNRPLRSSKRDKRLPTRGMLGNGLRVVTAWARTMIVETRGIRLTLEVDEATGRTAVVQREDVARAPGLTVQLRAQHQYDAALARLTIGLAGHGFVYSGPSCPWWYGPNDFARLFHFAPADATAAEVIRNLGLAPPTTMGARLARSVTGDEVVSLLKAMQERSKAIPAAKIGRLGPKVYEGCTGYAIKTGILIERAGGHVPYAVEAHVRCEHPAQKGRRRVHVSHQPQRQRRQAAGSVLPGFNQHQRLWLEAVARRADWRLRSIPLSYHAAPQPCDRRQVALA